MSHYERIMPESRIMEEFPTLSQEDLDAADVAFRDYMVFERTGRGRRVWTGCCHRCEVLEDLPRAERAEFAEEHDVAEMSSRQLKEAIRERNEARAEAERLKESARALEDATARLRAAEASRAKMEEDMTLLNERPAGLNEELRLERDRPVVVTDAAPEQLAQARAEGAEEARQAAEQAARKAEQDLEKARERERKAAEQLAQLKDAAEKAEAARAEAEKKAASVERSAASAELARFTVLFGQAQELANQMREILDAMQRNEDRATAERLARALLALAGAIEEAARDGA